MTNPVPSELRGYFNEEGLFLLWPSRGRAEKRTIALSWLASHFEIGKVYREVEVNTLLKSLHTFNDHALLRRELVDQGFISRNPDGSEYRRVEIIHNS